MHSKRHFLSPAIPSANSITQHSQSQSPLPDRYPQTSMAQLRVAKSFARPIPANHHQHSILSSKRPLPDQYPQTTMAQLRVAKSFARPIPANQHGTAYSVAKSFARPIPANTMTQLSVAKSFARPIPANQHGTAYSVVASVLRPPYPQSLSHSSVAKSSPSHTPANHHQHSILSSSKRPSPAIPAITIAQLSRKVLAQPYPSKPPSAQHTQ